jgi:hypothetical protein
MMLRQTQFTEQPTTAYFCGNNKAFGTPDVKVKTVSLRIEADTGRCYKVIYNSLSHRATEDSPSHSHARSGLLTYIIQIITQNRVARIVTTFPRRKLRRSEMASLTVAGRRYAQTISKIP